jgi:WD40 repeat protein
LPVAIHTMNAWDRQRRFQPRGKTVLVEEATGLSLWDANTGKTVRRLTTADALVLAAAFAPEGQTIVAALSVKGRCEVRRWNGLTGAPTGEALALDGKVGFAWLGPDTTVLTTVEPVEDDEAVQGVRLWSTRTGKLLHSISVSATVCAFSPDGTHLLTSLLGTGTTDLWDVATGLRRGGPWRGVIWSVFAPDGRTLFTAGHTDGRLWDVTTGRLIGQPIAVPFAKASFSRDSRTIVLEDEKKGAMLVEVGTAQPLGPHLGRAALRDVGHDGSVLLVDNSFRLVGRQRLPVPLQGEDERIVLWVQVATGSELSPDGAVLELDAATWVERASRLKDLGGPP